ncbi:UDP-N-acetylglucosamine 1-carboxyvinyltransferase [Ammonifex thiophilus]|uniref:UDP-N-acetylglucosamine 1-carboxyvinyltransferase n=1 Tax=Ammonifex thiophilus TaxID=444093 RepID=A0A3D8P523_9THEO|nr:UDP-N-acetylglucosamine 1-carboxyvinyltransferase [Ammonifex thiophilus]RDV82906.1 UDP-N-acetylglucosamine 1-carboxyvinyltransferase [Ammonifex thiophilus]
MRLIIKGPNVLKGKIKVSGAKNAILPILCACLLCDGESVIHGVPQLGDVAVMGVVLRHLKVLCRREGETLKVDTSSLQLEEIPEELTRRMRASCLVMGPLLARFGRVKIAAPGGCNIGARPIDLHLKGLKAMGAKITERAGFIVAEADRLRGAEIHLDLPSVGATENLMMAAVLAEGTTIIGNAAKEPEIVDLQNFLNRAGARIRGAGTSTIRVEGVSKPLQAPKGHQVIPDRIEAGTHLIAAALTGGEVEVENVIPEHLEPLIAKLREAGAEVEAGEDRIWVWRRKPLKAVDLRTMPYPGFPTDLQAPMCALLSVAEGISVVTENIFENRFRHVPELQRMGADIRIEGRTLIIKGVPQLVGARVEAPDLRAGAALVLAGLVAENTTVVERIEHIDRGYEKLEEKYRRLGAYIERVG